MTLKKIKSISENTKLIKQWAKDRKLDTADPKGQMLKLYEESGELAAGIAKDNKDLVKDAIGDIYVVLTILCEQVKIDILDIREDFENVSAEDTVSDEMLWLGYTIGAISESFADPAPSGAPSYKFKPAVHLAIQILRHVSRHQRIIFAECIEIAYEEIKDRKGEMRNGVFVKESDL